MRFLISLSIVSFFITSAYAQEEVVFLEEEVTADQVEETTSFTDFLHNDLWDIYAHSDFRASDLIVDIHLNPSKYIGENLAFYIKNEGSASPIGPIGKKEVVQNGVDKYNVVNNRSERRTNSILGVTFEGAELIDGDSNNLLIDLMFFAHSDNKGYFFKKVRINADWNQTFPIQTVEIDHRVNLNKSKGITVTKTQDLANYSLQDTNFSFHVELATQKAILYDSNFGITRVFPITAGALDVRDAVYDSDNKDIASSMTLLLDNAWDADYGKFIDFEDSALVKRSVWKSKNGDFYGNQESRILPSGYSGRPFRGIVDFSRAGVDRNKPSTYDKGYRGIAFHYQIESTLLRGFESHGCIRLLDTDLYILDAIVEHGPKNLVPVKMKMLLDEFKNFDSVYKRQKYYQKVVYSLLNYPEKTIKCPNTSPSSYRVRFFQGLIGVHTIADNGCLSKISLQYNDTLEDSVNYLTGNGGKKPALLIEDEGQHAPILKIIEQIRSKGGNPSITDSQESLQAQLANPQQKINAAQIYTDLEIELKIGNYKFWPPLGITRPYSKYGYKQEYIKSYINYNCPAYERLNRQDVYNYCAYQYKMIMGL